MALSEVSGFTTLSYKSNETASWFKDPSIPPYLQGKLLSLEHHDSWMSSINTLEGLDKVAATVALRNLKKHAEDALQLIFASGCMVSPITLTIIDPHSHNHASKYFLRGPMKKYLRALRMTKTKTITYASSGGPLRGWGSKRRKTCPLDPLPIFPSTSQLHRRFDVSGSHLE